LLRWRGWVVVKARVRVGVEVAVALRLSSCGRGTRDAVRAGWMKIV